MLWFKQQLINDRHSSEIYLERWILIKSKWLCVYLHRFHRPDYAIHHDHPWPFLSILLKGYYWEHRLMHIKGSKRLKPAWCFRSPGSIIFRKAKDIHRVELISGQEKPVSLFISGPRIREWGFVEQTEEGHTWELADTYLAQNNLN